MRDLGEMGLSSENCEQWFERGVLVFVGVMFVVIVVRVSEPFRFRGRVLNPPCRRFRSTYRFTVAPSHRGVKLSPATGPHFERLPAVKIAQG